MAFTRLRDYNTQRFGNMFLLRDDREYADVIFLYQSYDDVLVANTHYIKSNDYSGYVHCCGSGCPACRKNIRVQTKLFIPLYNITDGEIQFWDRNSSSFEAQLNKDVLSRFSNPSEVVFRITRHGVPRDVNTYYQITACGRNIDYPYDRILADCGASFPNYYSKVCREYSILELDTLLNSSGIDSKDDYDIPDYSVTPRVTPSESSSSNVSDDDVFNYFDEHELSDPFKVSNVNSEENNLPDYHIDTNQENSRNYEDVSEFNVDVDGDVDVDF